MICPKASLAVWTRCGGIHSKLRDGERVRLFTRRGYDWTHRYPRIVHSARKLRVTRFLIDSEAVVCGEDGISDFEKLHGGANDASVILYAFDLLAVDGAELWRERLDQRRGKLRQVLARLGGILFSDHHAGDGEVMFRHACKLGLEGIVSKRRDAVPVRAVQELGQGPNVVQAQRLNFRHDGRTQ